jgi:hypothetical protein
MIAALDIGAIAFTIARYSLALAGLLFLFYVVLLVTLVVSARGARR